MKRYESFQLSGQTWLICRVQKISTILLKYFNFEGGQNKYNNLFHLLYSSTSTMQCLKISRMQNLDISRIYILEISRHSILCFWILFLDFDQLHAAKKDSKTVYPIKHLAFLLESEKSANFWGQISTDLITYVLHNDICHLK